MDSIPTYIAKRISKTQVILRLVSWLRPVLMLFSSTGSATRTPPPWSARWTRWPLIRIIISGARSWALSPSSTHWSTGGECATARGSGHYRSRCQLHTMWSSSGTNKRGECLFDFIISNSLVIANRRGILCRNQPSRKICTNPLTACIDPTAAGLRPV